jgi:hypothetical protein
MNDTLAMLARCIRHQGESSLGSDDGPDVSVSLETHNCVPYSPTRQAPNLLVWTGSRHALALELKAE